MKCKITRQISGVEYYQYECKTHDMRWLGSRSSTKPKLCPIEEAAKDYLASLPKDKLKSNPESANDPS